MIRKPSHLVLLFFAVWSFDLVVNVINQNRAAWIPMIWLDSRIPFIPWFIYLYTLYFPLVVVPMVFLYRLSGPLRFYVWSNIFVMFVAYIIFLLIPTRLIRAEVQPDSVAGILTMLYHSLVGPVNLLPSLHVSMLLISLTAMLRFRRRAGLILAVPNLLCAVSVVFTRQHYVLDLITAIPLAVIALKGADHVVMRKGLL